VAPPQVVGFDPDFKNPRAKQVSAGVEHQIGTAVAASLNYVHISTDHLQAPAGPEPLRRHDRRDGHAGSSRPRRGPDSTIGILSINESTAKSRYDAVVDERAGRYGRLNAQAAYTLAWTRTTTQRARFNREAAAQPVRRRPEWAWSEERTARTRQPSAGRRTCPGGFALRRWSSSPRSALPTPAVIAFDTQNDGQRRQRPRDHRRARSPGAQRVPAAVVFDLDLRWSRRSAWGKSNRIGPDRSSCSSTRRGADNKGFGNDARQHLRHTAGPVPPPPGRPLFAPTTARYGGPRQLQLGARFAF
jgi:hypothetical protein